MTGLLEGQHLEAALRLLAAAGLGGIVGTQRELAGRPAGLRTHILVALGACLFTVVGSMPFGGVLGADPTRIASQVVVGIGFLGGGSIIRHGTNVRGLTTAANLWVMAAVGLACGLGAYREAAIATCIVIFVLFVLKPFERTLLRYRKANPPDAETAELEQ